MVESGYETEGHRFACRARYESPGNRHVLRIGTAAGYGPRPDYADLRRREEEDIRSRSLGGGSLTAVDLRLRDHAGHVVDLLAIAEPERALSRDL